MFYIVEDKIYGRLFVEETCAAKPAVPSWAISTHETWAEAREALEALEEGQEAAVNPTSSIPLGIERGAHRGAWAD